MRHKRGFCMLWPIAALLIAGCGEASEPPDHPAAKTVTVTAPPITATATERTYVQPLPSAFASSSSNALCDQLDGLIRQATDADRLANDLLQQANAIRYAQGPYREFDQAIFRYQDALRTAEGLHRTVTEVQAEC